NVDAFVDRLLDRRDAAVKNASDAQTPRYGGSPRGNADKRGRARTNADKRGRARTNAAILTDKQLTANARRVWKNVEEERTFARLRSTRETIRSSVPLTRD
ncbi:MAG: hypothetical protein J6X44_11115, partial [Thermoguttaceae bacterium]|nr:hypothetical protein [Thermoguttaceae bacterium]